ncbi:MAG TPA: hypothetical protein VNQ78_04855 [Paracoccus sp. (in: a-proteobacteria)]|uniref:hypothetical protein n=1 Tax=Paracoccus sp. TaxID=267 RepID=UPI002BD6E6FA|nr:hypothetical protein [Paracoccus sp. (in: a-proteobacteria)]HWL55990.1 hypothetical protein [Paracoccus sp. (in: a-proteobacteria)]
MKSKGVSSLDDAEAIPFATAVIVAARQADGKKRQDQDRFHDQKMAAWGKPVQPDSDIAMTRLRFADLLSRVRALICSDVICRVRWLPGIPEAGCC